MSVILVVDDDRTLQHIYAAALPLGGFRHRPAGSGEDALEAARALGEPPVAAVVDLHLPGIDGLETIRRLRQLPALAATPIILFTIGPDAAVRAAVAQLAGVRLLDKSRVGPARMIAELRQAIGGMTALATTSVQTAIISPTRNLALLEERAAKTGEHGHHAVAMLRSACLALAGQLHLSDLRRHPGAAAGLAVAVELLEQAAQRPASDLGSAQALAVVADDDAPTRAMMTAALRKHGMAVMGCVDGEALLGAVHAGPCDVVVTDMVMPRRSGVAVVTALRHEFPALPVIVVTALPAERQVFAAKYRPDEVVIKPCLLAELATKAWYHVVRCRLGRAPLRVPPPPGGVDDPWEFAN